MLIRLRLIGQMEAWTLTSESVLPIGRKTRALLAILALSVPRPVLRGRLAEILWSRRPEEQARASLRQEIHRLLAALGPVAARALAVHRDHLALRPGAAWVDVDEVARATPAKPAALSLVDGELLEDLDGVDPAFDAWLAAERERLRDKARLLAETLLREQNEPEAMMVAAGQLLAIDRTHEGAWRALMRIHAARGERAMAVQAFERCRAALSDELDTEPSDETVALFAQIRATNSQDRFATGGGSTTHLSGIQNDDAGPAGGNNASNPYLAASSAAPRSGTRLGVMPLHMSGSENADPNFGTDIAEEITAALARFRGLALVSSGALARFAHQMHDETAIRRAFEIDYLLDGSLLRGQGRLRIGLRLLDLHGGPRVIWTQRFDQEGQDLLSGLDEISAQTASQVDSELLRIQAHSAMGRPAPNLSPQETVLRAIGMMERLEQASFVNAGDLLAKAVGADPESGEAHAWMAFWHVLHVAQGWSNNPAVSTETATYHAEQAITLDPQNARALTIAGHVRAALKRRLRESVALHERALTLNPCLALAWGLSGNALVYLGDLKEAARRLERAKTLSPFDLYGFLFDTGLCIAALLNGDHPAAISIGRSAGEISPGWTGICKPYLAALGHSGLMEEAAVARARLLAREPDFSIEKSLRSDPIERPEHRALLAEGLRLAGLPER